MRISLSTSAALVAALALSLPLAASAQQGDAPEMTPEQQAEMEAYIAAGTPGPQHARLAEQVGDYRVEVRSWHAPGTEPTVETGTVKRTMVLDGRVLVEDMHSSMMGQPFTGHGMSGYDNVTGKYWSTWMDSMSTGLMVSKGSCDADGACKFTGSWHHPVSKEKITARMTTRWTSPTTEVFEMYTPGPDGKEMKMMEIVYTKQQARQ